MEIKRDLYLKRLIDRKNNGLIKVLTGIRRCGKSYLLDPMFKTHLLSSGVKADHIVKIELDKPSNVKFHNDANSFNEYIHSFIKDDGQYYILLDEIQLVKGFEFVLNGLLYERNLDVYVTGSNSKFLSSDIITEFRGRGDQIRINPLSFSEFFENYRGDRSDAWNEYITYGGMPLVISQKEDADKASYLKGLFDQTYYTDIVNRNHLKRVDVLDSIVSVLASSVGSLTNPLKIHDTFKSNGEKELSLNTVNSYLSFLVDSFLVSKALRYDVKGRKYIHTPQKYYFTDVGLRNACLNFRQQEESHLMENVIYNELVFRGYNVDVGMVEIRNNDKRIQSEVDFVCNKGYERIYIQSSLTLGTHEKTLQESRSLINIGDNFKKIIVVGDSSRTWMTDDGIQIVGLFDFMLNPEKVL